MITIELIKPHTQQRQLQLSAVNTKAVNGSINNVQLLIPLTHIQQYLNAGEYSEYLSSVCLFSSRSFTHSPLHCERSQRLPCSFLLFILLHPASVKIRERAARFFSSSSKL